MNGVPAEPASVTKYIPLNAADSVVLFTNAPISFFIKTRIPAVGVDPSILNAPLLLEVIVAPTPLVPLLYV